MDIACMSINVSHLLMALGEEVTVHDDLKSSINAAAAIRKAYAA
jgi:hypothetical protein